MMNSNNNFPQEHLVELKGLSDVLVGRITVYKNEHKYNLEIDIIQKESGKIYNHVDSLFGLEDVKDALASSIQILSDFLNSKTKH